MARKVIAEFDAIDGPFINKLNAIDRSVTRFEVGTLNAFGRVEKGLNGLLASAARLQVVSGLVAGGFGAGMATGFLDQATRIRRALKEAGDASQEGFEKAFQASQRSLSGFEAFSQGVQRMKKATAGTFDDSIRNMETLNKLLVLGGKTTQERMSTMIQFSQALQANVLQGEELRSLRENAPIELVQAIAREAGGSIEDLKKFGSEGKLTAAIMIRALKSLEAEADARMKSVTLTISEGATVLANAGIVAAEGFDRGLGLSRAAVAGLTGLARVLGDNAEAAEAFGKAAQVFLAMGLGAYAGGKVNSAIAATRAYGASLRTAAEAARAAEAAAGPALVSARMREESIRREIRALQAKDATQRQIANAYKRYEAAQVATTAALSRYQTAANAASSANARLALSARLTAASMNFLRGTIAFLGGAPGIILAAGLAFMALRGNVESAAERFERLTNDTGDAERAADSLRDVQSRLNEAISQAGTASDEASRKIVANTLQELHHKKQLLALETRRLEALQAERQAEVSGVRGQIAGLYSNVEDQRGNMQLGGYVDEAAIAQMMAQADAAAGPLRDKIIELEAAMFGTGEQIRENNILLLDATTSATGLRDAMVEGGAAQIKMTEEATAAHAQMIGQKQEEAIIAQLVAQYGEDSRVVAEARAFAERLAYEELAKSKGISGELLDDLMNAYDAAANLAGVDMASGVAAAADEAKSLADWLEAALGRAAAIARQAAAAQSQLNAMKIEFSPGGQALAKYGSRGAVSTAPVTDSRGFTLKEGKFVDPNARGGSGGGRRRSGGGGGGRARENELDKEALQFIESMMTKEEKRAQKLKEITDLRSRLVAKYGEEHQMVQQVDDALARMNETMEEGKSIQEQFWGTMSEQIAQNIEEWKGWGHFLRSLLASFVRQYGEDFFIALLTPGKQSGGGLGTMLGNALTGQLHSGGGKGDRQARSVPAAAFIGAPRFHKGLMGLKSDEFTAILQDGETVLPKGMSLGGGSVSIVNHNDFRGVDNASRAYIEGRLREMEKQIPGQAVRAVQNAQRTRKI